MWNKMLGVQYILKSTARYCAQGLLTCTAWKLKLPANHDIHFNARFTSNLQPCFRQYVSKMKYLIFKPWDQILMKTSRLTFSQVLCESAIFGQQSNLTLCWLISVEFSFNVLLNVSAGQYSLSTSVLTRCREVPRRCFYVLFLSVFICLCAPYKMG